MQLINRKAMPSDTARGNALIEPSCFLNGLMRLEPLIESNNCITWHGQEKTVAFVAGLSLIAAIVCREKK